MSEQDKATMQNRHPGSDKADSPVIQQPVVTRPSRVGLILALVALLAVGLGLVIGYSYWHGIKQSLEQFNRSLLQAGQDQAMMRERLLQTSQLLQQQQQNLTTQERALSEYRQEWEHERESMQQQEDTIYRALARVQQRLGGEPGRWQVAEAEYLMRMANHRLSLSGDPVTALAALKAADERLQATGDPGWRNVRAVLTQEMTALSAVPEVDRAGLNAALADLLEQLEQLPLEQEGVRLQAERTATTTPTTEQTASALGLKGMLEDLWQGFKSMMVIRHHDKPITAMLPPEQRYFLIQNLRLKLEAVKVALLTGNQAFFQDSLHSAIIWCEQYFAVSSPEVQGFLAQLKALSGATIAPPLPDISGSLLALQEQRAQLNQGGAE